MRKRERERAQRQTQLEGIEPNRPSSLRFDRQRPLVERALDRAGLPRSSGVSRSFSRWSSPVPGAAMRVSQLLEAARASATLVGVVVETSQHLGWSLRRAMLAKLANL